MCGGDSIKENNSYKRNNDDNVFLIASLLTYYKIKPEWTEITILQDILQLAELGTLIALRTTLFLKSFPAVYEPITDMYRYRPIIGFADMEGRYGRPYQ